MEPDRIALELGVAVPDPDSELDRQWRMWIEDAEMLIRHRAEELGKPFDGIDEAKVEYVVREAVVAHVRRPDDATQVTVSVDDGSTSKTYKSGRGRVSILDEWWQLLGLVDTSGAFSIDTAPGAGGLHPPFCSIYFGGTCSCGVSIAGRPIYEPYP